MLKFSLAPLAYYYIKQCIVKADEYNLFFPHLVVEFAKLFGYMMLKTCVLSTTPFSKPHLNVSGPSQSTSPEESIGLYFFSSIKAQGRIPEFQKKTSENVRIGHFKLHKC